MAAVPTNTGSTSKYSTLIEDDKKKVEEVLFLMDRFSVSEEFYHQLTMVCDGLPRSYLVKQCKNHLNELSHLTVTPGKSQGVQTSFKELLKEQIIDSEESRDHSVSDTQRAIKVKISGDGARMTRNSNYIILSFSILQKEDQLMSSRGNCTIAVVKGSEDYTTIAESFQDVLQEINEVQEVGFVKVGENQIPVELFLGGDYKFLLLIMGLSGATSHYSCLWCTIHKDRRYDMSKAENYYESSPQKRTLEDLKRCCHLK